MCVLSNDEVLHLIMACHGLSPCILRHSFLRTVLPEEARQDKCCYCASDSLLELSQPFDITVMPLLRLLCCRSAYERYVRDRLFVRFWLGLNKCMYAPFSPLRYVMNSV